MKKNLFYPLLGFILIVNILSCNKANSDLSNQQKVQAAVDSVRKNLSDSLKILFPSLNVLIQTPSDKIFVSSVEPFNQPNCRYLLQVCK
jgi:hypothetical protein